jgi:hypothetical protein
MADITVSPQPDTVTTKAHELYTARTISGVSFDGSANIDIPISGITGLGTGVATALAINVGSAGAVVTYNGDIGAATGTSLAVTGFLKDSGGVRLASNFTVTASTTFATITGFSINVNAGETYIVDANLHITADATGGCKLQFSGTCTRTSMRMSYILFDTNMGNNAGGFGGIDSIKGSINLNQAVTDGGTGITTGGVYRITGTIVVATSGTLTLQFAQNVASGTNTVFSGSYYSVRRIG